jgi:hypothetical protein
MHKTMLLLSLIVSGCGAAAVDRMALRHEQRAEVFGQLGDGLRAEQEKQRAEDLRATAAVRAQKASHISAELWLR